MKNKIFDFFINYVNISTGELIAGVKLVFKIPLQVIM